jgi:hypothetical protein
MSMILVASILLTVVLRAVLSGYGESMTPTIPPHEHRPETIFLPDSGCVPDDITAVRIAQAIWLPLYGESIYDREPFRAELVGDTLWVVAGSLPSNMVLAANSTLGQEKNWSEL